MRNFLRKHHMGAGIAVTIILLAAILLLSVHIQNITVTGSKRYNASQMEEFLFSGRWGKATTGFKDDKSISTVRQ